MTTQLLVLDQSNFFEWLLDMRANLRLKDLWRFGSNDTGHTADYTEFDARLHRLAADHLTPYICTSVKRLLDLDDFDDSYEMLRHLRDICLPTTDPTLVPLIDAILRIESGGHEFPVEQPELQETAGGDNCW